jgi:putative transposase
MARIARFVVPGLPHHVTQRGNRRERVFFGDDDTRSTAICSRINAGSKASRAGPIA